MLPPEAKDTKFANKPITTEEEGEERESIYAEHQPPVNQVDSVTGGSNTMSALDKFRQQKVNSIKIYL